LSTDNPIDLKGRIGIGVGRVHVLENTEEPKGMSPRNNLAIKGTGFKRHIGMPILECLPVSCDQPQEVKCGDSILNAEYNAGRLVNKQVAPANLMLLGPCIDG
jgi:hypothetical protein